MLPLLMVLVAVSSANERPRRDFPLFDGSHVAWTTASRVACLQTADGEICRSSSTPRAGYWPRGSDHHYVFGSGLQIAGIISGADQPGFPWPGDTVGAFFKDLRGDQVAGVPITGIYDWFTPGHREFWSAYANAPDLFHASLLGRPVVSDQDMWVRYWDLRSVPGRAHPAGLLIEQRTLSFNDYGLEDVMFMVFRLINVSARDASAYSNLAQAGYRGAEIAEIVRLGARFQDRVESEFSVQVPDAGYAIDSLYVGFVQDPDVFDFSTNYTSANLVFRSGFAYEGRFGAAQHEFPPEIFSSPFAAAPGLVMTGWASTPRVDGGPEVPFAAWSSVGSLPMRDPVGVGQLWRYLSLNIDPAAGDFSCTVANAKARRLCAPSQFLHDARHFSSAGPISLLPGHSATFIIAQVYAAPVHAPLAAAGWTGGGPGFDVQPGIPVDGARLVQGLDTVRTIDRIAGWLSHSDADGDGAVEMHEVTTVPRSLYAKYQRAAAVASNGFLTGTAPEAPAFHVLPGDGHATVVWQRSLTETAGDPFFALTSDPTSGAYDPNFRRLDVEGYRIWRGTSPTTMQPIASFDHRGTAMVDSTGVFHYGSQCAPELGVTSGCPALPQVHRLAFNVIQVAPGNRVLLGNGSVGLLRADTAGPIGRNPFSGLDDTGVPFAFVDSTLQNGREYYYAVTAFDVNSAASGAVTKESVPLPRPVRPRVASSTLAEGGVGPLEVVRQDGDTVTIPMPTLDSVTGQFSGPMPPAEISMDFVNFVPEIVDSGVVALRIDSIVATSWFNEGGTNGNYHLTALDGGGGQSVVVPVTVQFHEEENAFSGRFPAAPASVSRLERYGRSDSGFALFGETAFRLPGAYRLTSWGRGNLNSAPANSAFNGPRWWTGTANENTPDPVGNKCFNVQAPCLNALARTAGALHNVSPLWHIEGYGVVGTQPARQIQSINALFTRAADFRVTWGFAGAISEVFDLTHGIPVPFKTQPNASWGILNNTGMAGVTQPDGDASVLTWSDYSCLQLYKTLITAGSIPCGGAAGTAARLENAAALNPMRSSVSAYAAAAGAPTGTGFLFYLNGHWFVMQMTALPNAGTVWYARFYSGAITGTAAAGDFHFQPAPRPPAAPGLVIRRAYRGTQSNAVAAGRSLLERVHTVPDPYYAGHSLETNGQHLRFVNLPGQAIIRIYSASGILVAMINHNDLQDGGEATWDLRSRNGRRVASGVYFFHVESADGSATGRFVIVNR